MKKLLFLIIVIFLTSALFAQEKSNYEKYREAIDDSIAKSQAVTETPVTVEQPVAKSNKPATIFSHPKESSQSQTYVLTTDDDVNVYVVEPFDYGLFFTPFALGISFGYPYYGFGYPYYGFGYYDPWYYPYYPYYGYGYGYPYYGYPYYGYGGGYHPHNGDHGYGALGWHGYGGGYGSHNYNTGSIGNKSFVNSYGISRRSSSMTGNNFSSRSQSAQSYTSPGNKPTYRQSGGSSATYTRPEMSVRPKYNNTPTERSTFSSRQRTNTQSGNYARSSSPPKNSFAGQQRVRTSTQQNNRSYSTPRTSTQSRSTYSAPVSRSYSTPSRSSAGSSGSRSFGGGGHSSGGRR